MSLKVEVIEKKINVNVQKREVNLHLGKYGMRGPIGNAGPVGPQGVVGPPGPEGVKGDSGGHFPFYQYTPATDWVINHNLGYKPNLSSFDSANGEVFGATRINETIDSVTLRWLFPMSGYTICS